MCLVQTDAGGLLVLQTPAGRLSRLRLYDMPTGEGPNAQRTADSRSRGSWARHPVEGLGFRA